MSTDYNITTGFTTEGVSRKNVSVQLEFYGRKNGADEFALMDGDTGNFFSLSIDDLFTLRTVLNAFIDVNGIHRGQAD